MSGSAIYAIVCRKANRLYVGSAFDYAKRTWNHQTDLRRGTHSNIWLQHIHDKYGMDALKFVVLEKIDDPMNLIPREQVWIDLMLQAAPGKLINICRVAGSRFGTSYKMTPEQIARAAASHVGSKRTAETKARMSAAQMGHTVSPQGRDRMRAAALARWRRKDERDRLVVAAQNRAVPRARNAQGQYL